MQNVPKMYTFSKKKYDSPENFGFPFETDVITKDPGNERFRMRSDSRKKIIEKY